MSTVQFLLENRSYTIRIHPGSLGELPETLHKEFDARHVVVLSTPRVAKLHHDTLEAGLGRLGVRDDYVEVSDGERAKSLRTAARVYDELHAAGADRDTLLLGLGGGSLCDLAGFVASTYMRGLRVILVPTTLVAQVDASVGGKTGLNHKGRADLIGTLYPPSLVWIDPLVLATLPPRDLRAGMAEVIRMAAIWDAEFFGWLEAKSASIMALEPELASAALTRAIEIKAEIVGLDERSSGLRRLLTFGHPFQEVLLRQAATGEGASADPRRTDLRPGEALSQGMVFAVELSQRMGLVDGEIAGRLRGLLDRVGLPTTPPDWSEQRAAYLRALSVDKGEESWILLRELGRAECVDVSAAQVEACT